MALQGHLAGHGPGVAGRRDLGGGVAGAVVQDGTELVVGADARVGHPALLDGGGAAPGIGASVHAGRVPGHGGQRLRAAGLLEAGGGRAQVDHRSAALAGAGVEAAAGVGHFVVVLVEGRAGLGVRGALAPVLGAAEPVPLGKQAALGLDAHGLAGGVTAGLADGALRARPLEVLGGLGHHGVGRLVVPGSPYRSPGRGAPEQLGADDEARGQDGTAGENEHHGAPLGARVPGKESPDPASAAAGSPPEADAGCAKGTAGPEEGLIGIDLGIQQAVIKVVVGDARHGRRRIVPGGRVVAAAAATAATSHAEGAGGGTLLPPVRGGVGEADHVLWLCLCGEGG